MGVWRRKTFFLAVADLGHSHGGHHLPANGDSYARILKRNCKDLKTPKRLSHRPKACKLGKVALSKQFCHSKKESSPRTKILCETKKSKGVKHTKPHWNSNFPLSPWRRRWSGFPTPTSHNAPCSPLSPAGVDGVFCCSSVCAFL